jgi:hypothetical protein
MLYFPKKLKRRLGFQAICVWARWAWRTVSAQRSVALQKLCTDKGGALGRRRLCAGTLVELL